MEGAKPIDAIGRSALRARFVCVAMLVVGPVAWLVLSRVAATSDASAAFPTTAWRWQHDGVLVDGVYGSSPLHRGDRVVEVGGMPVSTLGHVSGLAPHRPVVYTVVRSHRLVQVSIVLSTYPLIAAISANIGSLLLVSATLAVGAFVFWNRPRDPAARLLLVLPALLIVGGSAFPFGVQVIDLFDGGLWRFVVGDVANALFWGGVLHIGLSLPEPWPAGSPRRFMIAGAYLLPPLLYALNLAVTLRGSLSALGRAERLLLISGPSARVVPALVVVLLAVSYRRIQKIGERRRWRIVYLVFGGALLVFLVTGQLWAALTGATLIPLPWLALILIPIPLALAAAIMRYRLFDIQVIVKRSMLDGSVTLTLGGISLAITIGLMSLLPRSQMLAASGAVAIAVVLSLTAAPRFRRVVGRRIYGERHDPYAVVSTLGRVESEADPGQVLAGMVTMVGEALRLPYVELQLRSATGEMESVARYGQRIADPSLVPLVRSGREIGHLLMAVRPNQEPFGSADRRLLQALAHQISNAADTVMLNAALQDSRERLVVAREEERRRLRRDLHDGLGPTLAAANIQISILRSVLAADLESEVDGIENAIRVSIKDLHRIVDGLRPPALDQIGLADAIREVARRFSETARQARLAGVMRVEVSEDLSHRTLAAAVEAAAYWISVEALTNAAKHANASQCQIRLRVVGERLDVTVTDNGTGLPKPVTEGVGLGSMRERAVEIGGRFAVRTAPGGGTVVNAVIPLHQERHGAVSGRNDVPEPLGVVPRDGGTA